MSELNGNMYQDRDHINQHIKDFFKKWGQKYTPDCKAKQEEEVLKQCPFCRSNDLSMSAFSFSEDCYISCACGAMIEKSVPWEDMNETEHDAKCFKILKKTWNTRAGETE